MKTYVIKRAIYAAKVRSFERNPPLIDSDIQHLPAGWILVEIKEIKSMKYALASDGNTYFIGNTAFLMHVEELSSALYFPI